MKRLFVSVPMKGRTDEAIRKSIREMKKIAEIALGEELSLSDSYMEGTVPETTNQSIWYLGKSIEALANADYFIGIDAWDDRWNGCVIEREIARRYGIPLIVIATDQYVFFNDIRPNKYMDECLKVEY